MDMRVAAYAVIERRGKILLTHWRRGHLHGWTLPGGGIEGGEDPRDAVVREIMEETGLEGRIGKLLGVDSRVMVREDVPEGHEPELHTIRIVYRATVKDGPLQNEVDGSSDEARWVPLREIKALRTLSLVQTGLRMAGISTRRPGGAGKQGAAGKQGHAGKPSGGGRSGGRGRGGRSSGAQGATGKPASGQDSAGQNAAALAAGKNAEAKRGGEASGARGDSGGGARQQRSSRGQSRRAQREQGPLDN